MKKRARRMQALALERQQMLKKHRPQEVAKKFPQSGVENSNALVGNRKQSLESNFRRKSDSGACSGNTNSGSKTASASLREQLFQKDSLQSLTLLDVHTTNIAEPCSKPHQFKSSVFSNDSKSRNSNFTNLKVTKTTDDMSVLSKRESSESVSLPPKGVKDLVDVTKVLQEQELDNQNSKPSTKKDLQDILSQSDLHLAGDEDLREIIYHIERENKNLSLNNITCNPEDGKKVLKQIMIEIMDLVCKNKTDAFLTGFQAEWQKKQFQRILASQYAARAAFSKQVDDEKRRESVAHTAWLYQMEKMQKKLENMQEQLENVNEGIAENEAILKRFRPDGDNTVCQEELHSILQILMKSSTTVRIAKDKCFMTEMARRVDTALCIACQEAQKGIAFSPCKHFALCKKCYNRLPVKKCPICRSKIQAITEVIIP